MVKNRMFTTSPRKLNQLPNRKDAVAHLSYFSRYLCFNGKSPTKVGDMLSVSMMSELVMIETAKMFSALKMRFGQYIPNMHKKKKLF